jgi:TolB protein
VSLRSLVPLERLEVVGRGGVAATIPLERGGTRADATISLPADGSGWYTLRAWSSSAEEPVLDIYPFATTSPIYVTVDGKPVRSKEDARYFEAWIDRVRAAAAAHTGWNDAAEKDGVLGRLDAAKAVFVRLESEAR